MNATDRELLELAAKAAGIPGSWGDKIDYHNGLVDLTDYWVLEEEEFYIWSPLTDDGDALRLAVKLRMLVEIDHYHGMADGVAEEVRGDPRAATRRAIVRAAAEIGRAMP